MKELKSIVSPVIRISLVFMLICGLIYPLVSTGVAQAFMQKKADGSLVYNAHHEVIGSELIGQNFSDPKYFHGRISSIENNANGSGSNNYAPSNKDYHKRLEESIVNWKKENPTIPIEEVPIDLLTNSGSGLDPHISPKAAYVQVDRIAEKGGISKEKLKSLIKEHTEGKALGLFGQEKINVLELNISLQKLYE
ncbi:potassium-transporting ATPase subunit KdpC [Bacillus massiliigorillae]|uniref:potassium-transporting ATPase subunit KdpC n=1 Tax=Bacillus massiliigorillae TaxID=1243664 RepID=UPI0005A7E74A|nr:potassium-transporting ATPase subunit KdpC [Bacillus massiliigorillae]